MQASTQAASLQWRQIKGTGFPLKLSTNIRVLGTGSSEKDNIGFFDLE
jgi:hypothetical protein